MEQGKSSSNKMTCSREFYEILQVVSEDFVWEMLLKAKVLAEMDGRRKVLQQDIRALLILSGK
ncbi:unnamed protein product [Angiostrongylus costaricensis]|uniref:CBFD_NFYB_HMF domain-containing protein n=1 Tax=Angiostrongylus costaricensis TaxID=334426 RepID=A0A0R3PR70_ANGCS|nr:unnamed protein product [Angiostrongylus costaricensis]